MDDKQPERDSAFSLAKLGSLSTCIAQSLEVWLHYNRDDGSLLGSGFFGFLFLLIFQFWMVMFLPDDNHLPLPIFAAATGILCIAHRLNLRIARHLKRPRRTGLYTGRPLLAHVLAFNESVIKVIEPWLVIAAGAGVYRYGNRPLGLYLLLGGVMLLIYVIRAIVGEWRERRAGDSAG
jgi:hypothetical protein